MHTERALRLLIVQGRAARGAFAGWGTWASLRLGRAACRSPTTGHADTPRPHRPPPASHLADPRRAAGLCSLRDAGAAQQARRPHGRAAQHGGGLRAQDNGRGQCARSMPGPKPFHAPRPLRAACRAPSPFTPLGPCVPPRQHNRSPCLHAAAYLMQTPHRNASHRPVPRPPAAARETATPSTVAATRCSSCQAPSLTATSRATHLKASLRAAPAAPRRRASPRSATASCAPRPCCACCSRTSGAAGGAAWS
jgi:hypothetical protein